jgi:hypothetical protein
LAEHFVGGIDTRCFKTGVEQGVEIAAGPLTDVEHPVAGSERDGEVAGSDAGCRCVTPDEIVGVSVVELDGARVHAMRGEGSGTEGFDPQEM